MWDGMLSAVAARFEATSAKHSRYESRGAPRSRKISFATLYDSIRGFMDGFGLRRFVVVLDHVDFLESLDADTAEKLLCMSEVHRMWQLKQILLFVSCFVCFLNSWFIPGLK